MPSKCVILKISIVPKSGTAMAVPAVPASFYSLAGPGGGDAPGARCVFFSRLRLLRFTFSCQHFLWFSPPPPSTHPPPQGQIQNVGKNTLLKPIFILTCATKTHTRSTISKLFYSSKQIMPIQTRYIWNNQISCFQALFPDYNWWFHTVKPASENNTIG